MGKSNKFQKPLDKTRQYNKEWLLQCQKQILPYTQKNIVRILIDTQENICSQCKKHAIYFQSDNGLYLCWSHANELEQKNDI